MKKRLIISMIALFAIIIFTNNTMASNGDDAVLVKGETNTPLGEYSIKKLETETIKGETLQKFELNYKNGKAPVTIYLYERPKCKEYIVRSNTMEIKYICRKSGFGAEIIYDKFLTYSPEANMLFISPEALECQKKISEGNLEVEKALGLIACYYPALLKNIGLL